MKCADLEHVAGVRMLSKSAVEAHLEDPSQQMATMSKAKMAKLEQRNSDLEGRNEQLRRKVEVQEHIMKSLRSR